MYGVSKGNLNIFYCNGAYRLACWVSSQHIEIFFSYFPQKTGFDISYKLSPLICQILFTGENISSMCLLNEARVWYFFFFFFFFFFCSHGKF